MNRSEPSGDAVLAPTSETDAPFKYYRPRHGLFDLELRDLWRFRELLYFLIWRDIKVRYKQTALGALWAILQPFLTMIVFTLVFNRMAGISPEGVPYPLFSYAGLLPWNLFAQGVGRSSTSLVDNAQLITKVYFPRLILPFATALAPLVDFAIAFIVLIGMMFWYDVMPGWRIVTLPLFIVLAIASALAVSLWLSALNVRYRDVRHAVPFLINFGLFASPVAYPASAIPEQWQRLYSLNPMVGVLEGFRWALIDGPRPDPGTVAIGTLVVIILLVSGVVYFKRMELTFADVI